MKRTPTALGLLFTLTLALTARAAPLDPADVPAGANWVVHVDVDKLLKNDVGQYLLKQWRAKTLDFTPAAALQLSGFDPATDLSGATLYGTGTDPSAGVAVFRGTFDQKKIISVIEMNASHGSAEVAGHVIYHWVQVPEGGADDGARHGAFADAHTLVVSRSAAAVETALRTRDGEAKPAAELVPQVPPGTYLFAVAKGISIPKRGEETPGSRVVENLTGGVACFGEDGGEAFLAVKLTARTPADAGQVRRLLGGLLAYANLADAPADKPVDWSPLLKGATVGGEDGTIEINVRVTSDKLLKLADEARAPAEKPAMNDK